MSERRRQIATHLLLWAIWPVHALVRRLSALLAALQEYLANWEIELRTPVKDHSLKDLVCLPVITTAHCRFIAERLAGMLESIGIRSDVLIGRPEGGWSANPHLVLCPQMFPDLPRSYIAFQMEQSVNPRWFTRRYFQRLRAAKAVFDYSGLNLAFLEKHKLDWRQLFYMPIWCDPAKALAAKPSEDVYDVLFYGDDKNPRRQRYLEALGKVCRLKVVNGLFGEALYAEMAKARLVVNIHYYENALLETTRLAEALSAGALIVSETSVDADEHPELAQLVDLVAVDDISAMVSRVQHWLADPAAQEAWRLRNREKVAAQPDWLEFYFFRFLLSIDAIDFDTFYARCAKHVSLSTYTCLSLPEAPSRRRSFLAEGKTEFGIFPGLRHRKGWIGCALSYKFLMRRAKDLGLEWIAVCEDDVEFPSRWQERLRAVEEYLGSLGGKWHVFSGLMATLHRDLKVNRVVPKAGMTFVHVDRLMSMVFNIYSNRVFDVFAGWDERNRDPSRNTIDKYLESQGGMEVVTTSPFLVGHKAEVQSTLWGIGNNQYKKLIAQAGAELRRRMGGVRS